MSFPAEGIAGPAAAALAPAHGLPALAADDAREARENSAAAAAAFYQGRTLEYEAYVGLLRAAVWKNTEKERAEQRELWCNVALIARRSEDGAVCKVVDAMGDHGFRSEISRFLQA
jgi:hypothetical protein